MKYNRKLIQYNDLVFDGASILRTQSFNTSYKLFDESLTFGHGSYSPHTSEYGLVEAQNISATIHLFMTRLPCEVRKFYKPFVTSQLSRYGKLWSVENNTIEWAYAQIIEKNERESDHDELVYDVTFFLPEGVWHKANVQKTFLVPHDVCTFMDCYDYKEVKRCFDGDCCHCGSEPMKYCSCCDCSSLEKDMALCYMGDMQSFYDCDGAGYRIIYSCEAGEKYFGDYYANEWLGDKICATCGNLLAGQLYSDTEIETRNVKIKLHGHFTNPVIKINGNANRIKGDFDGTLVIYPDLSVYFDNGCGECEPLSVDALRPVGDASLGWVIHPGNNRFVVDGMCCGTGCAYIETDAITA